MVIPLGLTAKSFDFPYFTLGVILITAVISILNLQISSQFEQGFLESSELREGLEKSFQQFNSSCATDFSSQICDTVVAEIKPAHLLNPKIVAQKLRGKVPVEKLNPLIKKLFESANMETIKEHVPLKAKAITLHQELGLLSKSNSGLYEALRAQFLHAGWLHLIFNLIFFLPLALPVEQRLGAPITGFIYLLGGGLGLLAEVSVMSDTQFVIGASASVFATAGAFLFMFWKNKLRVLTSLFGLINRTITMPVWAFFAGWILLQEFAGVLAGLNDTGHDVAHLAHLTGFASGAVLAWIFDTKNRKLFEEGMVFPYEMNFRQSLNQSLQENAFLKTLHLYKTWFKFNPGNEKLLKESLLWLAKNWHQIPEKQKYVEFSNALSTNLAGQFPREDFVEIYSQLPLELIDPVGLKGIDPKNLLASANLLSQQRKYWSSATLLNFFLLAHPMSQRTSPVQDMLKNLVGRSDFNPNADDEKILKEKYADSKLCLEIQKGAA